MCKGNNNNNNNNNNNSWIQWLIFGWFWYFFTNSDNVAEHRAEESVDEAGTRSPDVDKVVTACWSVVRITLCFCYKLSLVRWRCIGFSYCHMKSFWIWLQLSVSRCYVNEGVGRNCLVLQKTYRIEHIHDVAADWTLTGDFIVSSRINNVFLSLLVGKLCIFVKLWITDVSLNVNRLVKVNRQTRCSCCWFNPNILIHTSHGCLVWSGLVWSGWLLMSWDV